MAEAPDKRTPNSADTWEAGDIFVERFREAWQQGQQPSIESYAADAQGRLDVVVELVRVDMELRPQSSEPFTLVNYCELFPLLEQSKSDLVSLLLDEYTLRFDNGQDVDLSGYRQQFPEVVDEVQRELGLSGGETSKDVPAQSVAQQTKAKDLEFSPGSLFGGFEIISTLGTGGLGKVFLAKQEAESRLVAIKITDEENSEGRTLLGIDHPNIVRVYGSRVIDGYHVLVMRYEPGMTLAELLTALNDQTRHRMRKFDVLKLIDAEYAETQRLEVPSECRQHFFKFAAQFAVDLLEAVAYLHKRGILHRDIKPENILVTRDGRPVVMDFNVAVDKTAASSEGIELLGGTLAYMAPEHLMAIAGDDSDAVDIDTVDREAVSRINESSDLYSIGVVFFELLVGQRPYYVDESAQSMVSVARELLSKRLQGAVAFPNGSSVPSGMQQIVRKLSSPEQVTGKQTPVRFCLRYMDANDALFDLRRFLAHRPIVFAPDVNWPQRVIRWFQRHPIVLVWMIVLVTTFIGSFTVRYLHCRQQLTRYELAIDAIEHTFVTLKKPPTSATIFQLQLVGSQIPDEVVPGWRFAQYERAALTYRLGSILLDHASDQSTLDFANSYLMQASDMFHRIGDYESSGRVRRDAAACTVKSYQLQIAAILQNPSTSDSRKIELLESALQSLKGRGYAVTFAPVALSETKRSFEQIISKLRSREK